MDDKILFWTAFGAIGTTLGSFATALAVIVALWQTKYSTKKKLKLVYNDNIKIYDSVTSQVLNEYIGVTIINVGNRDVIIGDWAMVIGKDVRQKIMTQLQGVLKVDLPKKLEIEQSLYLNYEKKYFLRSVHDAVEKNKSLMNKKIKFQVMDSTGKKYYIYSKKTYCEYLKEYEKYCK